MTLPTTAEVQTWPDLPVQDPEGVALGTCRSVYADDGTGLPEWVEVALADDGTAFVPIPGTSVVDGVLRLGHPAELVASSPRHRAEATLSPEQEQALCTHYGVTPDASDAPEPGPSAARPALESRLRRLEQTPAPTPAPAPAPAPAPPASVPPAPRSRTRLLPLLAVPALLGVARVLAKRRRPRRRLLPR